MGLDCLDFVFRLLLCGFSSHGGLALTCGLTLSDECVFAVDALRFALSPPESSSTNKDGQLYPRPR